MNLTPGALRARALALLARREHSRAELAQKLARHGQAEDLAALLDALEQENLLSDARYAQALAHARAGRHGSLRLQAELRDKGVPDGLIDSVLADARQTELAAARQVWQRKFGAPPRDAAERARQMRFLASRGFPADIVRRVLSGATDDPAG